MDFEPWSSGPPSGAASSFGGSAAQWAPGLLEGHPPSRAPAAMDTHIRSPWEILQMAPRPVALLAPEERHQFFDLLADIAWGGDGGMQVQPPKAAREFSFAYHAAPTLPPNTAVPGPLGPPGQEFPGGDDLSPGWPASGGGEQDEAWPTSDQNAAAWPENQWPAEEDRRAEKKSRRHRDKGEASSGHRKDRSEKKGSSSRRRGSALDAGAMQDSASFGAVSGVPGAIQGSASRAAEMARGAAQASAAQASAVAGRTAEMARGGTKQLGQRAEMAGGAAQASASQASAAADRTAEMARGGTKQLGQRLEQGQQRASEQSADVSKRFNERMGKAQQRASEQSADVSKRFNDRVEKAQQRAAQTAVNNYARQATGGVVTSVPAPVSNAALGYAKKNPKEAMKFAKLLV